MFEGGNSVDEREPHNQGQVEIAAVADCLLLQQALSFYHRVAAHCFAQMRFLKCRGQGGRAVPCKRIIVKVEVLEVVGAK